MDFTEWPGPAEGGDGPSSSEHARYGDEAAGGRSLATASRPWSLRARESDSISLKIIYDQCMMGYGGLSRPDQDCRPNPPEQQTRGFQGAGNRSTTDLRNRIPELDLTFREDQDSLFANAGTGFGSPVFTTPAPANEEFELMSSLCTQQKQHNPHASPVASARMPLPMPTAPMTITYSGNTNVYDDIPADMAHGIMMIASSLPSNTRCPSSSTMEAVAGPASGCTEMKQKETTLALSQPETPPPMNSDHANEVGITKDLSNLASAGSPLPGSLMASSPPSTALVSLSERAGTVQGAGVQGQRELPLAIKAGIRRHFEKRRERMVNLGANQQGLTGEKGEGDGGENVSSSSKPGNDSTALTGGKRLLSPASTWQDIYNSSSREKFGTTKRSRVDDKPDASYF